LGFPVSLRFRNNNLYFYILELTNDGEVPQPNSPKPELLNLSVYNPNLKYILYWNEAYGTSDYGFCCGQDPFIKVQQTYLLNFMEKIIKITFFAV
jgi:hypothetical protein